MKYLRGWAVLFASIIIFTLPSWGEERKTLVFIGDSLTEGYGVDKEQAYPALVQKILDEKGFSYNVINGGVSGSTTSSGMSRLKWFMKTKPDVVVLALGANDGLRGIQLSKSRENLEKLIQTCQSKKIKVVLAGMQLPPNYGGDYTKQFKQMYNDLIKTHKIPSIPFLIEGVAGRPELNIEDGIHPNPEGHEVVAQTVFKHLKDHL